jgi:hypothetical protein
LSSDCFCCMHPERELIDNFCLNRIVTLESGERITTAKELQGVLKRMHPDTPVPSEASISKHSNRHISRTTALQLIDGVLCDGKGKSLPGFSVEDTLKAYINIGVRNALEHPESVSARNVLDAIQLLWKIKNGITEQDDYNELWTSLAKGQLKKKRGKKKSDLNDEAIEGEFKSIGSE